MKNSLFLQMHKFVRSDLVRTRIHCSTFVFCLRVGKPTGWEVTHVGFFSEADPTYLQGHSIELSDIVKLFLSDPTYIDMTEMAADEESRIKSKCWFGD